MESETIKFLDAWYPVMQAIGEVQDYYNGKNDKKTPFIAPDPVGALIDAYIKAQRECGVKQEITIIEKSLDQKIIEAEAYREHCIELVENCKPQDAKKLSTQYQQATYSLLKLQKQWNKENA